MMNFEKLRILLWDIDGTLLIAPRGGSYKDYFAPAMERVYGSSGILRGQLKVSGMTDLQIALESLQPEGFSVEQIYSKCDEFCSVMGEEIERVCATEENRFVILPGAREILGATDRNPLFVNALLTGNLPLAARFKLKFVGLDKFFDFSLGAFGNCSHRRIDLPAVAAQSVSTKFDYEFAPSQFIVLGDTPNDIACARHFGAKAVAVATGRNYSAEALTPHKPDYLLNNLTDTAKVLRVLETL
ncbi:MAG: HAD hydrolase-like protein [Acidobacteriota bacterium]|nr:HAD hydrolase-like protein [Acidobacteriota bacterium]